MSCNNSLLSPTGYFDRRYLLFGLGLIPLAPFAPLAAVPARIIEQGVFMRLAEAADLAKLPKGYRTYTIFLSSSYDYAGLAGTADVAKLLAKRAPGFGQAIGKRDVAVLLATRDGRLNVAAGRTLLERIKQDFGLELAYENGPYILVFQRRPTDPKQAGEKVSAIALRGQSRDQISATLNELEQEIRAQRANRPADTSFADFWSSVRDGWLRASAGSMRSLTSILIS